MIEAQRIPMFSLRSASDGGAEGVQRELLYLKELERQAGIANWSFGKAIDQAVANDEDAAWAHLQGGMFAAIVVQRLLWPGPVNTYPHLVNGAPSQRAARRDSQSTADDRGARLRSLLDVSDDSTLRLVQGVRDAFEHIDERLDCATRPEVMCIIDWYITQGAMIITGGHENGVTLGLRCYQAPAGILYCDAQKVDLFALDDALFRLRDAIVEARGDLEAQVTGRSMFGGGVTVNVDANEVRTRLARWIAMRKSRNAPVTVAVWPSAGGPPTPPASTARS